MKNKKTVITIIVLVVIIAVSVAAAVIFSGLSKETALKNEILDTAALILNDDPQVKTRLTEIVCNGKYEKVERDIKAYLSDVYEAEKSSRRAREYLNSVSLLSNANLESDGPDFVNSLTQINSYLPAVESSINTLDNIRYDSESYMSAGYSKSQKKLFKSVTNACFDSELDTLYDALTTQKDQFSAYSEILTFLSDNRAYWKMVDGEFTYTSADFARDYQALRAKL